MRTSRLLAALGAATLTGGSALAQFTINPPDTVVTNDAFVDFDISGGTIGTSYSSIDITLDWSDFEANNAFSQEAGFGVFSGTGLTGTEYIPAFFGQFEGDSATNAPASLTFSSLLQENYIGGDSLFLTGLQQFAGYNGNWSNISVTLNEGVLPTFALSDTDSVAHAPNQYHMWDLVIGADGTEVVIDTFGTSTSDTGFGPDDTELYLLDTDGLTLLGSNDDADFTNDVLLSELQTTLDAGTYTVVVGTFNIDYDGTNFTTDTTGAGTIALNVSTIDGTGATLNFNSTVPEPGSLALLGLGGLAMMRRRRSA